MGGDTTAPRRLRIARAEPRKRQQLETGKADQVIYTAVFIALSELDVACTASRARAGPRQSSTTIVRMQCAWVATGHHVQLPRQCSIA